MLKTGFVVDGKYKILNQIGQGGMSTVYLAVNEQANKLWAIKEVRKDGQADFEVIKQSQIVETNLLKKLNHRNLPSIIDVIDQRYSFLIVMDYIEGKPLSDVLSERKSLPCEDIIEWAKQLCNVLEYLHTRNPPIIYRDMKPSNIMLKPDGSIVLIDFGIAREFKEQNVEDTSCLGTRGYAAPEQFGGQGQTDVRTDIYCLGATIYHLVTGHNPSNPPYEMYPIRRWNSSFSSGLENIILRCTQKNPDDRYQSCEELLYALEHYKEEEEDYKRAQQVKWYIFLIISGLTLLMTFVTAVCYIEMNKETFNIYEEYLNTASMTLDLEEKYQYFEDAIVLSPAREKAYALLLETMQEDGIFSENESQVIRRILPAHMNDLAGNKEGYIRIAYELGIMYFYYFENKEDVQNAEKWLNIAIGHTEENIKDKDIDIILGEKKAFRARHLYEIIRYYHSLDFVSKEGDYEGNYRMLWQDLSAITTPDLSEQDNNVTALVMYNFMANQLVLHARDYRDAEISKEDMEYQIEMIRRSVKYDRENLYETELYNKLYHNLNQAEKMVHIAFDV